MCVAPLLSSQYINRYDMSIQLSYCVNNFFSIQYQKKGWVKDAEGEGQNGESGSLRAIAKAHEEAMPDLRRVVHGAKTGDLR